MFGLEILDVVIGLVFVYLLLSLFATALNEYIAAVLNLRGKELAKGLGRLLDDLDEGDALQNAWDGVGTRVTTTAGSLTEQLYNHRLIRPFATRQGWVTRYWRQLRGKQGNPRLPSYIPARTFALALLDVLGVDEKEASLDRLIPSGIPAAPSVDEAQRALDAAEAAARPDATAAKFVTAARWDLERAKLAKAVTEAETLHDIAKRAQPADAKAVTSTGSKLTQAKLARALAHAKHALASAQAAHDAAAKENKAPATKALASARQALARVEIAHVLAILKQESPIELTEHLELLAGLPQADKLASALQVQVAGLVAGAQTRLQNLHDGVEVWFNNSMDRVSGAYKRTAQGWLFVLGLLIASCMNADTIDIWRRLEADDGLRAAMVRRAEAAVAKVDSTAADSASAIPSATTPADSTTPPAATLIPGADSQAVRLASANAARRDTSASDSAKLKAVKQARENYLAARTRLDSMELKLGWTPHEAMRIGLIPTDTTYKGKVPAGRAPMNLPFWLKLLGLFLTALAISLGAPFWFDLLNKVISIRTAGRSPAERPKSPEGGPKRTAEQTPK